MKTPADIEKEYFATLKNKEIKKVSLNLGAEIVEIIDELAGIFGITRTLVIESVLRMGLSSYIKLAEKTLKKLITMEEYKDKTDKLIDKLNERLEKIKEFKKKWKLESIPDI